MKLLASALLWILLLAVGGIASTVYGVGVLFGVGWAFVVLGIAMLVASTLLARGAHD